MDTEKILKNPEEIKIFMDNKRREIFRILFHRKIPMTSKQIADEMQLNASTVHFHTNKLLSIGVLKISHTEIINGIVAKYLEPTATQIIIDASSDSVNLISKVNNKIAVEADKLFNQAKIDFMDNCHIENNNPKRINYSELYLTKEEFIKFNSLINKKIDENQNNDNTERKKYKLFFAISSDEAGK